MAAGDGYSVDDVMDILCRAYSFRDVTREDVKGVPVSYTHLDVYKRQTLR